MEGNLSRARNSLYVSSPTSVSSLPSDGSTPSPPIQLRSAAILREARESSPVYAPGHARMGSDNALRIGLPVNVYPPRSASALGAAGGYRQPLLVGSKSVDQMRDQLTGGYGRSNARDPVLEPLSEDEVMTSPDLRPGNRTSAQLKTFLSPTFGVFDNNDGSEKGLTRSASVAQMRDLKDQMKDLKGKISSLREQARADSMKRRSLQSLRTPSPFTHARVDQWYAEAQPEQASASRAAAERNPWNGELSSIDGDDQEGRDVTDDESVISGYEDPEDSVTELRHPNQHRAESPILGGESIAPPQMPAQNEKTKEEQEVEQEEQEEHEGGDDMDDMQTENGDIDEEAVEDDASESGESSYHDTLQHPISHEDREDAFDYEHFILHSALGTISQQRLGRRGSFSSEGSVETTRGPIAAEPKNDGDRNGSSASRRGRRGSGASTSTVESFATATERPATRTNRSSSGSDEVTTTTTTSATTWEYPAQLVSASARGAPESPLTAKKGAFSSSGAGAGWANGANGANGASAKRNSAEEPRQTQQPPVARRPASSAAGTLHRPSISSFESTGTMRSFPLINRKKASFSTTTGIITPNASSPDEELKNISETLMNETASICEQQAEANGSNGRGAARRQHHNRYSSTDSDGRRSASGSSGSPGGSAKDDASPAAMQTLLKEDRYMVERLVGNLGRCVLGLTESGRASAESRMYRRRIDAARRILEGVDAP